MCSYYEIMSSDGASMNKIRIEAITSYKEAVAEAKREMAKPSIIEAVILKDGEPIEYYGPHGHSYL